MGEYRRSGSVRKQRRTAASFAKYGVYAHVFALCKSAEESLHTTERHFQEILHVCGPKGLNCRLVSTADRVGRFSGESRQRMGEKQRGCGTQILASAKAQTSCFGRSRTESERKAISEFQRQRGRLILQIGPGKRQYRARKIVGVRCRRLSQGNISSSVAGRLKTYKGFKYQYEETR